MWPFDPKEKFTKETSTAEDWDVSLWLLDPDRTIEELVYFAETGQRPTRFTKLTQKALSTPKPKGAFPVVSYPAKATKKGKPRADFPPNFSVGHTSLDRQSETYYLRSGKKWEVPADTPPQTKKNPRTKEGVKGVILNLKRPVFKNQLEEKQWCAREVSLLLDCDIKVSESRGMGLVIMNGQEIRHPIENWDWHGKTVEEFLEHLYGLWVKHTKVNKHS